jgi:hypothetical protein
MDPAGEATHPAISRRTTIRAAAIGASALWVAPLVQVVSMDSASAASGAPAPRDWTGHNWRDDDQGEDNDDQGEDGDNQG